MEKILILAYPGSGKTYTSETYDNVVDFENLDFIYIYDKSIAHLPLDMRKGNTAQRGPNPGWPENYFDAAMQELKKGKILMSSFISPVLEAFDSAAFKALANDVRIILVMPKPENFDEFEERYKSRNNSSNFIERRRAEIPSLLELFNGADAYERILLNRGQFLDDALVKHGISLKKRH